MEEAQQNQKKLFLFKEEMKKRTKDFAHKCVNVSQEINGSILGLHIIKQLVRCSTSVAANYRASCIAQTIPSVVSKMSIVIEEADECMFWIEFALEEKLISDEASLLINEAREISSILIKARSTLKSK